MAEPKPAEASSKVTVLPPNLEVALFPNVADLPQGFLGIPLFARFQYASQEKQLDGLCKLIATKNRLLRELQEQRRLMEIYAAQSERARHMDDIRMAARLDVQSELIRAQFEHEDALQALEHQRLRREVGKARLEPRRDRRVGLRR